ncbi:MAG: hypothetical protein ACXVYB_09055 [Arthrobacter sp.]
MTENQWPQDGSYGTPPATRQTALEQEQGYPGDPVYPVETEAAPVSAEPAPSKTDVAKDEAGEVRQQATESAQNVAETAKAEAANVAAEVKTNAKDLLYQARADLSDQAGAQQQKVAQGLRSISSELHSMAAASEQPGVATDLVRQAAERSSSVASWLDGRDPGSLLDEVKSFARQRPGTFLLLAAGAGILAGRLTRSLSAGAPEARSGTAESGTPTYAATSPVTRVPGAGTAVPPPPVQLPGPDVATAGMTGTGGELRKDSPYDDAQYEGAQYADQAGAGSYPPNPLAAEGTQRDQWADDSQAAAAQDSITGERPEDDYRDDPFGGGRR